jgi:hypothetical protein
MTDPIELAQRWIEAFNARDADELLAVAHPEIVLRPLRWGVRSEYRGHAGVREWFAAIEASPEATTVTPDRLRLFGRDRVVVEGEIDGVDARFVALYALRDDRLAEVHAYMSDREMLEQLGLLDEPAAPDESGRERSHFPG